MCDCYYYENKHFILVCYSFSKNSNSKTSKTNSISLEYDRIVFVTGIYQTYFTGTPKIVM